MSRAHVGAERPRSISSVRGEIEIGWMLVRVAFAVGIGMIGESLRQGVRR